MYPAADPELLKSIPDRATFWTPKPSEIGDDGFGFFRNVTDLRGTTAKEVRGYLAAHTRVFDFISSCATSSEGFEVFASALEGGSAAADGLIGEIGTEIDDFIDIADCDLGALELGVGAVAYTLSAAKMFPASSCRSHSGSRSWCPFPVVYVAASQRRAELLEKLVIESGCGFVEDPARPDLLVVSAPSIPPCLYSLRRLS